MIDLVRPRIDIPDDSKIGINHYRNPYLTKLTIKVLPQYSKIDGPTFIHPLQNHSNVAIVQSLPLWRNQNFRIGLLWQQNIRNSFNRSHIGFLTEYRFKNKYTLRSKNLVGSSFLTSNQLSKSFALSGRLITVSALYSCFFESSSQYFHTIGGGIALDNGLSVSLNKRISSQASLKATYEKKIYDQLFLRLKYDTQVEKFSDSTLEAGIGYYFSNNNSFWLRSAIQSDRAEPNIAVQFQYKKKNSHCVVGSVQYRNEKSIIYLGYKCPSFNFIFPIFGTDSAIPALLAAVAYVFGYFKRNRKHNQINQKDQQTKEKNRVNQLKLISDKANENYRKQQQRQGLLIEEVFIGQKNMLNRFLSEDNRLLKLARQQQYKQKVFDGTTSFRFYVQKGQLFLPKGNKLALLGLFYRAKQSQQIQIYVRYIRKGKQEQKIFKQNDAIIL